MRKSGPLVAAIILFSILAAHGSKAPVVFGLYSLNYSILLCGALAVLIPVAIYPFAAENPIVRNCIVQSRAVALSTWRRLLHLPPLAWLAIVCLMHILMICYAFPPGRIFSSIPHLESDYSHHYYQVRTVIECITSWHRPWGYDFTFCAGYPVGTLFDVDMKLFEAVSLLLTRSGWPLPSVYNTLIFLCLILIPFVTFATCRLYGFSLQLAVLTTGTIVLMTFANGLLMQMVRIGMIAYATLFFFAQLSLAVTYRATVRPGPGPWLTLFLILSITFMMHILAPVLIAPQFIMLLWCARRNLDARQYLAIAAACLAAAAVNLWWIVPVVQFLPMKVVTNLLSPQPLIEILFSIITLRDGLVPIGLISVWGLLIAREIPRPVRVSILVGMFALFVAAQFSYVIPILRELEPFRFRVTFVMLCGFGVAAALLSIFQGLNRSSLRPAYLFPLLVLALPFLSEFLFPKPYRLRDSSRMAMYAPLIRWIEENTDNRGRIALMEDVGRFPRGAYVAAFVDRQFIGGPFAQHNMVQSYANFTEERFFDRRVAELTEEEAFKLCEQYDIRWVITTSREGAQVFSSFDRHFRHVGTEVVSRGAAEPTQELSPFAQYFSSQGTHTVSYFEVLRAPNPFLVGSGTVTARLNEIIVENASPGEVVLKYHWLDRLAVEPELPIEHYPIDGNPVGFIRVRNGSTRDFRIYNAY